MVFFLMLVSENTWNDPPGGRNRISVAAFVGSVVVTLSRRFFFLLLPPPPPPSSVVSGSVTATTSSFMRAFRFLLLAEVTSRSEETLGSFAVAFFLRLGGAEEEADGSWNLTCFLLEVFLFMVGGGTSLMVVGGT